MAVGGGEGVEHSLKKLCSFLLQFVSEGVFKIFYKGWFTDLITKLFVGQPWLHRVRQKPISEKKAQNMHYSKDNYSFQISTLKKQTITIIIVEEKDVLFPVKHFHRLAQCLAGPGSNYQIFIEEHKEHCRLLYVMFRG